LDDGKARLKSLDFVAVYNVTLEDQMEEINIKLAKLERSKKEFEEAKSVEEIRLREEAELKAIEEEHRRR
jgi:hypothetical protein